LTAREGAFLAMLLPSPVKYSTSFYEKHLTDFAKKQVNSILIKMRQANVYTEEERVKAAKKRFYWESDFYPASSNDSEADGNEEDSDQGYEDYLNFSYEN